MTAIFDGAVQVTDSIANLFGCVAKFGQYYVDVSSVTAVLWIGKVSVDAEW